MTDPEHAKDSLRSISKSKPRQGEEGSTPFPQDTDAEFGMGGIEADRVTQADAVEYYSTAEIYRRGREKNKN